MSFVSRRRFLAMASGAGGLAALGAFGWFRGAGRSPEGSIGAGELATLRMARQTSYALGCEVSIAAFHASESVARDAVAAAFVELDLVERVMSIYRPDSELRRLNQQGSIDQPHPYLVEVLRHAQSMAEVSGGAFDVTVQPLWDLYASARRTSHILSDAEIAAARGKVDWRRVHVTPESVRLSGEGTAVTLNGIAQGFAADRVLARLRERGIEHALVNTGEIGSLGRKATGEPWCAGIQHPRRQDAYVALARLDGRCMSTSGDYATVLGDHGRLHHIFDPSTGKSPDQFASVTVVAPTGMQADALSTAVFVLGADRGMDLLRSMPGADAMFVLKDGTTQATDNFPIVS